MLWPSPFYTKIMAQDIYEVKFLKPYMERGGKNRLGKRWYITYSPGQAVFMNADKGRQLVGDGTCELMRTLPQAETFRNSHTPMEVKRPARKRTSKTTIKK